MTLYQTDHGYSTPLEWFSVARNGVTKWWEGRDFPIEEPAAIISSILYQDLNFQGSINTNVLSAADSEHFGWKLAFTVSDEINSKKLIEEIASNTRLFPKLRPHDGSLSFVFLRADYKPENVDIEIDPSDVIKYKFNKSKMDSVKNKVRVFYKKDIEKDDYDKVTDYVYASSLMPDYTSEYYGLESDNEDTTLDFESDYIRDEYTANELRDFLCMYHSNQKLEISLDLPNTYSHLETGDIFYIPELINDFRAYGMDYTGYLYLNGQITFPFFIIKEVSLKKNVSIIAEQLHYTGKNQPPFEDYLETIGVDLEDISDMLDDAVDDDLPEDAVTVVYGCTYSDATNYNSLATTDDGSCSFPPAEDGCEFINGDFNGDGLINILDIVIMINMIVNPTSSGDTIGLGDTVDSSLNLWSKLRAETQPSMPVHGAGDKFSPPLPHKLVSPADTNLWTVGGGKKFSITVNNLYARQKLPSFMKNTSLHDIHTRILKSYKRPGDKDVIL